MNQQGAIVYLLNDTLIIQGVRFDAHKHSHHAIKILVNFNDCEEVSINGLPIRENTIVLDADVKHELLANSNQSMMLLINPDSPMGSHIRQSCLSSDSIYISNQPYSPHFIDLLKSSECNTLSKETVISVYNEVLSVFCNGELSVYRLDERIRKVFDETHRLEEKRMSITEIASLIHLSESRFMHLFKDEIKIPFRQYLSWLRMLHAIRLLIKGCSMTETALISGFSDVSHLHKTFYYFFGVKYSAHFKNSSLLQVYDYSDS
jgi:AraC-like DNA-binding protein